MLFSTLLSGADWQTCQSSPAPSRTGEMCLLCAQRFIILRVEFHSPAMLFAFDIVLGRIYCFQDRCDLNRLCLLASHSGSSAQFPGIPFVWLHSACKLTSEYFIILPHNQGPSESGTEPAVVTTLQKLTSCNTQTCRMSINITKRSPEGRSHTEVIFTFCCPPVIDELRTWNKYSHSSLKLR